MTSLSPTRDSNRPLRLVFFGASIVSDWGNPAATTMRAILRALNRLGVHTVYLEERGNRPTIELLHTRGPSALLAFTETHPDIFYRTYVLPEGAERAIWIGRELSVADAVVVLEDTSIGVVEGVAQAFASHLVKVAHLSRNGSPSFEADLVLTPVGSGGTIELGPAVDPLPNETSYRNDTVLVVSYDDPSLSRVVADALSAYSPALVAAGPADGAGWEAIPEVNLPERYARARAAVVIGAGMQPLAAARLLLPMACGCPVIAAGEVPLGLRLDQAGVRVVTAASVLSEIAGVIEGGSNPAPSIPVEFSATTQAARLVNHIQATLVARSAARS